MNRSTAMLTGAATVALAAGGIASSPASADPIPVATSYADLLTPVPDAMERIAVDDASQPAAQLQLAQYDPNGGYHHHHHHHHHHHSRRWYRSNGYYYNGGQWIIRPVAHHHHHHHHHHQNGY